MVMAGELPTHEKIQFLSAASLFSGLDYKQREKIASVVKSNFYSVDSYICKEGEPGETMDLIGEGTVRLEVDGLPNQYAKRPGRMHGRNRVDRHGTYAYRCNRKANDLNI